MSEERFDRIEKRIGTLGEELRGEMQTLGENLGKQMLALNERTGHEMRVLHEEVLSAIAAKWRPER